MKKKILKLDFGEWLSIIGIVLIISTIGIIVYFQLNPDGSPFSITNRGGGGGAMIITTTSSLSDTNWVDHPVFSGPAILNTIMIGNAESGGQIAVYDITSNPTNDSIVFFVTGSNAMAWYLDRKMDYGIMVNTTGQEHAMFFFTPLE